MIPAPLSSLDLLYLARDAYAKTGSAWLAVVEPKTLPAMAEAFLASHWHLEDVSGLDTAEGAVSVYHFDHFDTPGRITVIAVAPHDAPVFPSIASVYYGAEWHERETRDFFGFVYEGNPNFIPLLLAEDMADVHPLVKDEGARASLRAVFAAEDRGAEVLRKAEGFTLLDEPLPEPEPEPEPAPEPAPVREARPEAEPAPAPEVPAASATAQPAAANAGGIEDTAPGKTPGKAADKATGKSAGKTAPAPEKGEPGKAKPENASASGAPSRSSAAKASPKGKNAPARGKGGKK